ncbi:MAG: phenylacetaldehyde dehydrogenase [Thermoleophilaceae bacterium]|jgi:phenylacetaldehyde dehydrogenase|nr:phenylacetaldehyde dehydrogenase [Thermoleophilaceae bacterium]
MSTTEEWISKPKGLLIGGEWREAADGAVLDVYDPARGEVMTQVAAGGAADVDAAAAAARKAFEDGPWATMTASDRGRALWRLADLIEEHADEFAMLETLDIGKPLMVARHADVALAIDMFRYMAGWATKISGQTFPISVPYAPGANFVAYTVREPVGVVGQIIPWNFPLLMASWKLGPALAAGNTVILKPAEQTPLSAIRLGELLPEAGFPDGVVNVVNGYGESAGAAIAAHPGIDKVAFTGSTEVGRSIMNAAAGNMKKLTLELGGKSPNIVFADADVESAVAGAANAIFLNQGEVCAAGSRLYVEQPIYEKVLAGIAAAAEGMKVGPGVEPDTEMGPLVSKEHRERVESYLALGESEGARRVTGGERLDGPGYFLQPSVLADVRNDMRVVQEEIFGPVLVAQPFDDPDEVAALANDTPYGLAAAVWTTDLAKAHRMTQRIKAGTVWVNTYNIYDAALPFGGYKQSGWGREMGEDVLSHYTETKSICIGGL